MSNIEFSKPEKEAIVTKIKGYFNKELDQELGQFDAEFLLDFFSKEIGGYYYNRGLHDAQSLIESRLVDIADAIYEIEKPTEL